MSNKIKIEDRDLDIIKELLFNGKKDFISTKTFEAIIELLEEKEKECSQLRLLNFKLGKDNENVGVDLYEEIKKYREEITELKTQIKNLQDECKRVHEMYYKESYRNYKLSEISCEWNARRSIEKIEDILNSNSQERLYEVLTEVKRFFKECTPNKDIRIKDFIPEDEYIKCLKSYISLQEIKKIAEQILDDDDNHCPFELTKQILNKCEVANEKEN